MRLTTILIALILQSSSAYTCSYARLNGERFVLARTPDTVEANLALGEACELLANGYDAEVSVELRCGTHNYYFSKEN